MENKIFEPDTNKFRYTIKIEVYNNCAITKFEGIDKEALTKINYHDVIGVLETQKQHIIWQQRESNMSKKLNPKKP